MVGISLACTPTRQPEMDLTIEMRPTFPVEVKLPSKKVQKPCNFEQSEMVDELDLRPFRSSFHSTNSPRGVPRTPNRLMHDAYVRKFDAFLKVLPKHPDLKKYGSNEDMHRSSSAPRVTEKLRRGMSQLSSVAGLLRPARGLKTSFEQ